LRKPNILKQIATLVFIVAGFHSATASGLDSITFEWQWNAGNIDYSSGPDGEIAFDLYMRTEDDAEYDFEYPAIAGIDNCWLDGDQYTCQATLEHPFEPGIHYFFSVLAYLIDDREAASTLSNEIEYIVDDLDSSAESTSTTADAADEDSSDTSMTPNANSSALYSGQGAANAGSSSTTGGAGGNAGGCFIIISLTE